MCIIYIYILICMYKMYMYVHICIHTYGSNIYIYIYIYIYTYVNFIYIYIYICIYGLCQEVSRVVTSRSEEKKSTAEVMMCCMPLATSTSTRADFECSLPRRDGWCGSWLWEMDEVTRSTGSGSNLVNGG